MNPETGSLRQHRLAAIIVAAGRGERAGGALPKQYHLVGGLSVLARSLIALGNPAISRLVCVISPDADALYETAISDLPDGIAERLMPSVHGGATRQASVLAGLERLASTAEGPPELVLVHDAARPFATAALIDRAIAAAALHGAAVPRWPSRTASSRWTITVSWSRVRIAGPCERFKHPRPSVCDLLLDAHRQAAAAGRSDLTDDAGVLNGRPSRACLRG